ncbi:MAG: Gfo/Idh/MocA family oxidoreductase [Faecalimonas sp.]|nr:Gfo/Idh/MocA family oxidoreductase [Faecalimonas sp.]
MVKLGIIGVGRISNVHIAGIKEAGTAQITAICDVDEEKLKTAGEQLGIPEEYRFKDYHDLINCPEVEAVEICTPNYLHVPMAIDVVKAGKPVEVEKPLGISSNEGIPELMAAIEEKKVPNMMCFSYRFMPAVRYAKHLIEEGKLGKIINVNIEYLQSGVFIPNRRLEWRFVKEYAGSGALADLGVHLIDMTRFLVGEFKSICALKSTVVDKRMKLDSDEYAPVEVDDITSFVAKMENDAIANFLVTKCAIGEDNTIIYEIYGTDGVLKFNLNKPEELTLCVGEIDRETKSIHTVVVPQAYHLGQEECFINAVMGKEQPYFPSVAEGAKSQKVVDAALKSADEHIIVDL